MTAADRIGDHPGVRVAATWRDLIAPVFKFIINPLLLLGLAYVGKMVYDSNPYYGGYIILSLQWPLVQDSKELATASTQFVAALPSSLKRSLVCEEGSMAYKYILKWVTKAHAQHCINGLTVTTILEDGSLDVEIECQCWTICFIVHNADFSCERNTWADQVPFWTRHECFEVSFIPPDRYNHTTKKFVLTNKSYTRLTDLYRWCGLIYVDVVEFVPRTNHRSYNDDQLVTEYSAMYRSFEDRLWGTCHQWGSVGNGAGQVGTGRVDQDILSGQPAKLAVVPLRLIAADGNSNRSE